MAPTPIPHFRDRFEARAYHKATTKKRKADEKQAKFSKGTLKITGFARRVVAPGRCCHGNGPECKACAKAAKSRVCVVGGVRLREVVRI